MTRKNNRAPSPDARGTPNARSALNRMKIETALDVGGRLSAGDSGEYKSRAEQTGSGMVDKMAEDYEIKAESSGFATDNNKYNSSI